MLFQGSVAPSAVHDFFITQTVVSCRNCSDMLWAVCKFKCRCNVSVIESRLCMGAESNRPTAQQTYFIETTCVGVLLTAEFTKASKTLSLCRYTAGVSEEDEEAGPAVQRETQKCRQV